MRYYISWGLIGLLIATLIITQEQKPHIKVVAPTHIHYTIYYQGDKLHEQIKI